MLLYNNAKKKSHVIGEKKGKKVSLRIWAQRKGRSSHLCLCQCTSHKLEIQLYFQFSLLKLKFLVFKTKLARMTSSRASFIPVF